MHGRRTVQAIAIPLPTSMTVYGREATPAKLGGREAAFEELVREHQDMVFHLGLRLLGDRAEAEDLSQEVFLKVYRALDRFRGESSLKTWIYKIVVNSARNRMKWWRRRFKSRTLSLDDDKGGERRSLSEVIEDPDPDPERLLRSSEIRRRVLEGLTKLSHDHREILVLRDLEDLSYEEIAQALDLNEGTVKSRIARARLEMREMLSDLAGR